MTKEMYTKRRNKLINEAQSFIDSGDMKAYEEKMNAINALDEQYEAQAAAQANLDAVSGIRNSVSAELLSGTLEVISNTADGAYDAFDTPEYHAAFMNYVNGGPIPAQFRNDNAVTKTSDITPVVPTTTLNRIVERMETIGNVLNLVTRTSYKGGMTIPTSSVKPTATWVAEGAGTETQKEQVNGQITFAYYKLRVAVSMSLEVETVSLSAFEAKFVKDVADAMGKALEQTIISGDGIGKPKGILAETPVSGQALSITSGTGLSYELITEMEASLPREYENGAVWAMTKKTFMAFQAITDDNGQPVARVNYGLANKPERAILGRPVEIIDTYMSNYTKTVTANTIVAFIFRFEDYTLNTNLGITVSTYEDHTNEDKVRKAVMLVDGKVVDKNSLVTLTVTA